MAASLFTQPTHSEMESVRCVRTLIERSGPSNGDFIRRSLKSNPPRNEQFDFGASARAAHDPQSPAHTLGAFFHSGQAPVAVASRLQHLGIDSAAVVANHNANAAGTIFQFDLDMPGVGVAIRVNDGFAANTIQLFAKPGPNLALPAFYDHSKFDR